MQKYFCCFFLSCALLLNGCGGSNQPGVRVNDSDPTNQDTSQDNTDTSVSIPNLTGTDNNQTNNTAVPTTDNSTNSVTSFSISGAITLANDQQIDSDINNSNANNIANDSFSTAQWLAPISELNGFLNTATLGPIGQLQSAGDERDFYHVQLSANQIIKLSIFNTNEGDFDLYLYDESEALVDSALGNNSEHTLQISTEGIYYIEVRIVSGFGLYHLSTNGSVSSASLNQLQLTHPFVTDEVLIRYREPSISQITVSTYSKLQTSTKRKARMLKRRLSDLHTNQNSNAVSIQSQASQPLQSRSTGFVSQHQQAKLETLQAIAQLRKDPRVEIAEPNYLRKPLALPNDPYYQYQTWHYEMINLPQAWDTTTGSNDVIVAVVDTGVLLSHPDLQGQLVTGYDFITDLTSANDGDGLDSNPDDPGDNPGASSFHGTHVAGTIAAVTNNGVGVAGIAWNAKVMPLRALGVNGGTSYDVMQAILYAAGLDNDSGTLPSQAADIANLSLGGPGYSQLEQDAYQQAVEAGLIIIAAAGNEGSVNASYPAAYTGVTAVSAVDAQQLLTNYSNYGSWIDVTAPGGDLSNDDNSDGQPDGVMSTIATDDAGPRVANYAFSQGTSMASPHVAGVAALMESMLKAAGSNLTPSQWESALSNGELTNDIGGAGKDNQYGYGLINATKALTAAQNLIDNLPTETDTVSLSTFQLEFGALTESLTFSVTRTGTPSLVAITPYDNWITITEETVDSDGFGTYRVSLDRSGLSEGNYASHITVTSSLGSQTINLSLEVMPSTFEPSTSQLQLLLLDEGQNVVATAFADHSSSTITFELTNIPAGSYSLYTSTDIDNDGIYCEAGEFFGLYNGSIQLNEGDATTLSNADMTIGLDLVPSNISISSN